MVDQLKHRLAELLSELHAGQAAIADLESKLTNLRATVLRISGAIQVLEEEISQSDSGSRPVPSANPKRARIHTV
jgi:uncharacterized coiled-coil protein SlyX